VAEFCLDCLNKICNTNDDERDYVISKELYLCEECGEMKHVVICCRGISFGGILRRFTCWIERLIDNLKRSHQHKKP